MLEQVLKELNNWFAVPGGKQTGTFTVEGGGIELPFLREGQYFRIHGSVFNDGVYQYPADGLTDEVFDGVICPLAVPKAVVSLADEIAEWQEKNGAVSAGPYQSESIFGQYSYTKAVDAATGGAVTWQSAFGSRLSQWRKI